MKIITTNNLEVFKRISFRNKYDLLANDAVKDIFPVIRDNYQNKKDAIRSFEYKDSNYIVDFFLSWNDLLDEKFNVHANFNPQDKPLQMPPYIEVKVDLRYDFSEKDFERLNYIIYEFIRHEYEHFSDCDKDIQPDEEYYANLRCLENQNLSLLERAKLVEKNVISPYEIDAYSRSIVYLAKKKKVRFQKVLGETLDIMFFGFNEEKQSLGYGNMEVMKIYNRIFTTIKERIEQMFGIRRMATLSTQGLGRGS